MTDTLIVYFTHRGETYFPDGYRVVSEGNAEKIAKKSKDILDCDLIEIIAEKKYPTGYKECCAEAKEELDRNVFPKLKQAPKSIDQYKNIIIVYPCWWGTMPRPLFTFLDSYNFDGKGVHPICTHEGSGLARVHADLELSIPNAILYDGIAIEGHLADECDDELKEYYDNWIE